MVHLEINLDQNAINKPGKQSSSPGESHPQALTDPDVNLSAHPAPHAHLAFLSRRELLRGSSHLWLTQKRSWTCYPLRSTSITETSTLLRGNPPLCSASVLSSLWGLHLDFSLVIGTTGFHVPHESPDHVHATFMPAAARTVKQVSSELILGWNKIPVLTATYIFDTSSVVQGYSSP
jgi:hypothetical protein